MADARNCFENTNINNEEKCLENNLDDIFNKATEYVASKAESLQQDELLYLYGRYKQVTVGPCSTPKPGFFDFKGKSKWTAWHSLGEMSKEEAMKQYIEKLTILDNDWDSKCGQSQNKKAFGPVMSTFMKTEIDLTEEEKTPFDLVKEGNVKELKKLLAVDKTIVNSCDEQGLSLLHWASDRGHVEVASLLLSFGADIDCQDEDGQTALHYACSCGHENVVTLLMKAGASPNIADADGLLPRDVVLSPSITNLLGS